jgi:hypothetical protein
MSQLSSADFAQAEEQARAARIATEREAEAAMRPPMARAQPLPTLLVVQILKARLATLHPSRLSSADIPHTLAENSRTLARFDNSKTGFN